jgi:hypothetical protein
MPKRIKLSVPDEMYEQLADWADYEALSVAELIRILVEQGLMEAERTGTLPAHRKQKSERADRQTLGSRPIDR